MTWLAQQKLVVCYQGNWEGGIPETSRWESVAIPASTHTNQT